MSDAEEGRRIRVFDLNRPAKANALDAATVEALSAFLDLAENDGVPLVVLQGSARVFSAGLDLSELESESDESLLYRLVRIQLLLERVERATPLTVAIVEGAAIGSGADLALAAAVRIALPTASIRFPGAQFGAVLGTARLASLSSPDYATYLTSTGARVEAREAAERGLWKVLPELADARTEIYRLLDSELALPAGTGRLLRRAVSPCAGTDPLGALVRSLAEPGLVDRVRRYVQRQRYPAPATARCRQEEGELT